MSEKKIEVKFNKPFKGVLMAPKAKAWVGCEEGCLAPYDMLFGALASCMYVTFANIAKKKCIHFDEADINITGEKRDEVPATLKWVKVSVKIKNAEKQKGLIKAVELASQYCSVYQTLAQVADMSWEVDFE